MNGERVRRSGRKTMAAAMMGLSLVAAACGGDDGGSDTEAATAETVDQGIQQGVEEAKTATTEAATVKTPTTLEEWKALWATQREAVVKKATDGKFGISADGKSALISDGYTIDLSKCPAGWNNLEGLSDTEIKIGHTTVLSGTLAIYGQIANGWTWYNEEVNKTGIKDSTGKTRKINLIFKDDGYDSARTIPLVDEMIDSEKVFLMLTLGSPNTMKTYDKLNQRCVPQPLVMTGHPAWGDPITHPWTTGEQMAYNTEAVLWGAFIEDHADELKKPDGKITVSALVMNNDFGKAYDGGFKAWLAQTPLKADVEYKFEVIEPSAPTITDPMTTLASHNPEIFIAMTAGTSCTQSVTEAAQNGLKESALYLFQPSVCKSNAFMGKDKVGGDGMSADGWWAVGGGLKAFETPAYDTDAWAKYTRGLLEAKGVDWKTNPTHFAGIARWGWSVEQALTIASQLKGGLSRVNLMVAVRNMDMTAPFLLEGAKFNLNGNKDAYFTEASEYVKYNAAKQAFDIQGDLIELSGKSSNCAWDQSTGACK
jgi:branched-chain amino acid transport system substrate-binding protein